MDNNFTFLKNIDKNLFDIISDAEKLYKDEYFEQCIGQIRRFAESVCKNTLGENYAGTFDEMLATLKDKSKGSEQEKEFIDDLYFLKQQGNLSLHSTKVKQDGLVALECLKRAFEVALNYSVYVKHQPKNLLKLHYDVELLVTGKKNKSLAEQYSEKKHKLTVFNETKKSFLPKKKESKKKKSSKEKVKNKLKKNTKNKKTEGLSLANKFLLIMFFISLIIIGFLLVLNYIHTI